MLFVGKDNRGRQNLTIDIKIQPPIYVQMNNTIARNRIETEPRDDLGGLFKTEFLLQAILIFI